jgi:hypothetical protein
VLTSACKDNRITFVRPRDLKFEERHRLTDDD